MRVGYVRVSSADQSTVRQLEGVEVERTYTDVASGKDVVRPQLAEMLRFVREGDVVVVHSMDRLARDVGDLRALVADLTGRGVAVEFVAEHLAFAGGVRDAMADMMLTVLGAVAQFERAMIRERQREGIAAAKARGVYAGRKPSLTPVQADELRRRAAAGEPKAALARAYGVSRETVYAYLRAGVPAAPAEPVAEVSEPVADVVEFVDQVPAGGLVDRARVDVGQVEAVVPVVVDVSAESGAVDVDQAVDVAAAAAAVAEPVGRVVDLSGEMGEPVGTWRVAETMPRGTWVVLHHGERVASVRREAPLRGRRGWSAVLDSGRSVSAPAGLAAAGGGGLWRTRDLAVAGIAHHLAQGRPGRRR